MERQAALIYLDTHAVVWLYAGMTEAFSEEAKMLLEREDLLISPMVILEVEYLYESEKINVSGIELVDDLSQKIGLEVCVEPFPKIINIATRQAWTRDPFDRVIVSQAQVRRAKLLTKDSAIRKHYPKAVW